MKISISTNEIVEVKLTERGADILNCYNAKQKEFLASCSPNYKPEYHGYVAGDSYRSSLWSIAVIFGPYFVWGMDSPFEKNEIIL